MLVAAGTAVVVLLIDLIFPRWYLPTWLFALLGAISTGIYALTVPVGQLALLCADATHCSYRYDSAAQLFTVLVAALTAAALLLYLPALRAGDAPAGEVGFLLACAMTGGVVLAGAGDLLTLIVALETLTLPLYALVALHDRRATQGAVGSVTFFTTSVVATAVTLLGAALVYLQDGAVHLTDAFALGPGDHSVVIAGLVLLLSGLGFKVAAVPLHAWAPSTYDGAPVPIAMFLSTASKLGGVIAILYVTKAALAGGLAVTAGITLAGLATLSLLVGTLVALRQERTVRLLAWSSVAQAGFILAPLGALVRTDASQGLFSATVAYTLFFLALEVAAFSGVASLRPPPLCGGSLEDLYGLGRSAPWRSGALALALIGLAGLPPALAGLFAKITVLRALLDVRAIWLALVVALVSIVGLAVYWRPLAALYRSESLTEPAPPAPRAAWSTVIPLALAAVALVVLSVVPQLTLNLYP
jgi:NADH-quinone oxidoreductase subunit N